MKFYINTVRSFESQIESKMKSSDVFLRYSEQYLEGEPRELIKGCPHLDKLNGYLEAKKLLSEKYGEPYKISNAYIKKINEWPCIQPGYDLALNRFSTFIVQCQSAMNSLPFLTIHSHPHNMQSMVHEEASFPTSGPVGEEKLTDGEGHDKVSLSLLNLWPL